MSSKPIAAWLLILAAWGCQSTPTPTAPQPGAPQDDTGSLLDRAQRAPASRASALFLEAAEGLLEEGDVAAASAALARVDAERLNDDAVQRWQLARARVALQTGDLTTAEEALDELTAQPSPRTLPVALLQAELLAARQRPADAALLLMDLEPAADSERRQEISDIIWRYLGQVPAFEVLERADAGSGDARAWWLLKAQMLQSFTLAEQQQRLEAWRGAWPQHPAALSPPQAVAAVAAARPAVRGVGLMLPLSGPLSRAGRAVRDAFLAAYVEHRGDVDFDVTIYDTAAEPVPALYERALLDGRDVLIGPLAKDHVAQLNGLEPEIPVLALNYLEEGQPAPNLLQLGLAIEDEALTLQRWLADDEAGRLLMLHNSQDWASRAARAIDRSWPGALETQVLENIRTFTESVGVGMQVAASEERRQALEELLGAGVEFRPRARADIDAVLALVTQFEVTALVPALKFHFADHLPVYATSQTLRGADREALQGMNGFRVAELPWLVLDDRTWPVFDGAFGLTDSPFVALYALGVDAFRLADRLPLLADGTITDLLGSTGALQVAPSGRVERRLARAVVQSGRVRYAGGAYGR